MNNIQWDWNQKQQKFDRNTGIGYVPPLWWVSWEQLDQRQKSLIGFHFDSIPCIVDEKKVVAIGEVLWRDIDQNPITQYSDRNINYDTKHNESIYTSMQEEQVYALGDTRTQIVDGEEGVDQLVYFWSSTPCRHQIDPIDPREL